MTIEKAVPAKAASGWLEVDARWLAGLFGLRATGEVRVVLGTIQVGVEGAGLTEGLVVEGSLATAFLPTGWRPKGGAKGAGSCDA